MKNHKNIYSLLVAFLLLAIVRAVSFSAPAMAAVGGRSVYGTSATDENVFLINEIQVANIDGYLDPSFNFGGWVELYNPGSTSLSLHNLFISDDINHLRKCRLLFQDAVLQPKGFKTLWFGANNDTPSNINFSLDSDGGILYISNDGGEILLSQIYPPSVSRTSYARKVDGGEEWGYTANPTCGTSNVTSIFATERVAAPMVDTDSRKFTEPFDFRVEIPEGSTLKYSTDGVAPGISSGQISADGLFHVAQTSVYRFCLVAAGKLPSPVVTRSFLLDEYPVDLPILSVVTDSDYLYDDSIGIFVKGVNGKPGNGQKAPCNWNMDWNRPANVELILPTGEVVVNQETDIAVAGGWSRSHTPHSFKVKSKKKYEGMNYLPYDIFPLKPHLKNKVWQVRNGGNDSRYRLKDAALQEIVHSSGLAVDGQACQAVIHFINGKFGGLLNVREPNNKDYAYANYGIDDSQLDQFQICGDSNYCQICGTDEAFLKWYDLSFHASDNITYGKICHLVDIDKYVNYMAVEMYVGCGDYAQNNIKGFRQRTPDGKFRFVLYDLDSAFGKADPFHAFESKQTHTFRFDSDNDGNLTEEIKFVTIFLNMLENGQFRKKFVDTYCLVAGSVFESGRSVAIIDSMAQQREAALQLENLSPWEMAMQLKSHVQKRQAMMMTAMKNYERLKLSGTKEAQVKISSNIPQHTLTVNRLPIPTNRFEGSLFLPAMLKAELLPEYKFVGWKKKEMNLYNEIISWGSSWKYYDGGSLDNTSWKTGDPAIAWREGAAPMGYNLKNPDIAAELKTQLDYGPKKNNKRPTYYFYKSILLEDISAENDSARLIFLLDDGAVVYLNGKEIGRYHMPEGEILYGTYASSIVKVRPELYELAVPVSLFKKGENILAIEVHNYRANSMDLYFDGTLQLKKREQEGNIVSTRNTYRINPEENAELVACYEPLSDEELAMVGSPVVINEISADNSVFVNDYFRKNDWVELYNRTHDTIDVAGMYLSDDRNDTHKYQIAEGMDKYATTIAPHEYLVLWADGLLPISQLHTNFKLAREGGEVILTAADESWADTLIYESHDGQCSVGRYPDGAEQWYVMNLPTFKAPNVINFYAKIFHEPEYPVGIETVTPEDGDFGLKYRQRTLTVYGGGAGPVRIHIYNMCGQCVGLQQMEGVDTSATITLNDLPRGSYIASIRDAAGRQRHIKFLIATDR